MSFGPVSLPRFDQYLLRTAARILPDAERGEWLRGWEAELWHMHHRGHAFRKKGLSETADLTVGILRDAFWMRTDAWRRALSGSATICLLTLLLLSLLSTGFALLLDGSWHLLSPSLVGQFKRTLVTAPLVIFVAFATSSRRHVEQSSASMGGKLLFSLKRQMFFATKMTQVLLLAFLLSADLCEPMRGSLPHQGDMLQLLFFISFALMGLRWTFSDQQQRCKQCLQSLEDPARVGRPSHNLLEWNGTQLNCKKGHGLLSVPEIETSWCQSSQWTVKTTWEQMRKN